MCVKSAVRDCTYNAFLQFVESSARETQDNIAHFRLLSRQTSRKLDVITC